jgi:enoyl-CoA hydratase/carnithine racemase
MTKRMMNRAMESSMEAVLDDELAVQSFLFSTEANRRGVERFLSMRSGRRDAKGADASSER